MIFYGSSSKRDCRKKKSSEDNVPDQSGSSGSSTLANPASNTRTIKISYGPQGEGTVLKIPAQIGYFL